jgi:hypothetical protein
LIVNPVSVVDGDVVPDVVMAATMDFEDPALVAIAELLRIASTKSGVRPIFTLEESMFPDAWTNEPDTVPALAT